MNANVLILLPLISLMTGVVLELILGRVLSPKAKGWLAFAAGLTAMAGVLMQLPVVLRQGAIDLTLFDWDSGLGLVYHVDGLSLVFNLMATVIGSAILLYCIGYMAHEPEGTTRFYALMLTFIAGLVNLVSSANLMIAYVSWEIIGLCSYFLVGFWYKQSAATQGARKVLVMTHLAGYGFLAGILILFSISGTFNWTDPALQAVFTTAPFLLLLVAAMAKSVMFPLHTWIPEAMNAPTPVSALLHSACYVKAGIYLVARMYSITAWQPGWNMTLMVIGAVTMLVGAFFALAQTDMKRLLAYSTISQLGHIIIAFGLGTPLGIAAGIFYCMSHGLFKGTLFLCAGAVQHECGTRDMRQLGGLAARMPVTTVFWLIASASIIGVPLGNGFVAKWLLIDAALESGQALLVIITWLVSVFTAFYILKATVSVFFGDPSTHLVGKEIQDGTPSMRLGMGVLAGLCVLFGVAPQILLRFVVAPAVSSMGFENVLQLSFLGLRTGSASISVTLGALIVLVGLALGALVLAVSRPGRQETAGLFTGGDPLPEAGNMVGAIDFTDLVESEMKPVYRFTNPDPIYGQIFRWINSAAEWLNRNVNLPAENRSILMTIILSGAVGILVWLF